MAKVYMVTSGCYSDYRVNGIYSSRKLAGKAKELFNADNIKVIELDTFPEHPLGLLAFDVEVLKDGSSNCERRNVESFEEYSYFYTSYSISNKIDEVCLCVHTYAKDKEHAVKIANEKRIMLLAADKWGAKEEDL